MQTRLSYTKYINSLLLLFFVAVVFKRQAMDSVFMLVSFTGIYLAIKQKKLPFQVKEVRLLTWLFWGYFFAVIISIAAHPRSEEVVGFLTRELYFVLAPFAAMALIKTKIDLDWLALGAKLGLMLSGIIVIYGYLSSGINGMNGVSSGFLNANMFANLVVVLFFIVVVVSFVEKIKHQKLLTIIALAFGGIAIIYTGSKGGWISFIILLLVVAYIHFIQGLITKRRIILSILSVFSVIALLVSVNDTFNTRVSSAYSDVVEWYGGKLENSSTNERLEMIRIGFAEAPNIPFFGNGYRNINKSIITDKYNHEVHNNIRSFTQLHNAYLTNFVGGGYPFILALLLNLFVPLVIFVKSLRYKNNQLYASVGVIVAASYIVFGLFNNLFGDVFMNSFYTLTMAILLPHVQKTRTQNDA